MNRRRSGISGWAFLAGRRENMRKSIREVTSDGCTTGAVPGTTEWRHFPTIPSDFFPPDGWLRLVPPLGMRVPRRPRAIELGVMK